MRFPAFLARHRRLLGVGLASLLLHLAALAWLEFPAQRAPGVREPAPLTLRIARAGTERATPRPAPGPSPASRPAPGSAPQPAPAPDAGPEATSSPLPALAPLQAAGQGEVLPGAMPGQFRVSPAPPARLDYRVSGGGAARLEWRTDGSSYRLALDGILGALDSEGGLDDGGLAPLRASEPAGLGRASTEFDRARGVIVSHLGARRDQLAGGTQDRASLLLQLAGMGRANPDQLRGVLAFWIGAAGGARQERYEVMEMETVDTGIGALEALRLAQLAPEGAPRLEVWLAPGQAWLPVQLRLTLPDGAVRTQTLDALEIDMEIKNAAGP
ncbi:DUF3108 domain-containing protein [Massilia timonae]|uniref:DUF3108 domain-containing protein n=1 Tax=Massilia timonae CCUG 45783 TaxID=883126 RepID=K9DXF0_9BURK|nr:DUF3108 domain-containing protein [Massilia timonae]EKU81905.1 hypothetical protein HMPREF9710_02859 [Massilia timonae CCUG 45783]